MSDDTVTISAKVSEGFQKQLDQAGEKLRMTSRSDIIRYGLEYFLEAYNKGRIPLLLIGSQEEDGEDQVSTKALSHSSIPLHRSVKSDRGSPD